MEITEIAVVGITPENWPDVVRVFRDHGCHHACDYPLYSAHVSTTGSGCLNGWSSNSCKDFNRQVRNLRKGYPQLTRLTVSKFIEIFG